MEGLVLAMAHVIELFQVFFKKEPTPLIPLFKVTVLLFSCYLIIDCVTVVVIPNVLWMNLMICLHINYYNMSHR